MQQNTDDNIIDNIIISSEPESGNNWIHNFDKQIEYLVGDRTVIEDAENIPALPIFSDIAVKFLNSLSDRLLKSHEAKKYGDVISYAFWIRRTEINKYAEIYRKYHDRIGRGLAFHIAPSNIPVQFAVSMTFSFISGNISVIKLSANKDFEQVHVICNAINNVLEEDCPEAAHYICILRYPHIDDITAWISGKADIRMVWGGDHTVESIRKIPMPPRCIELDFADRASFALLDADKIVKTEKEDSEAFNRLIINFYTDTYYSDQNACSSSRMVIWAGNRVDEAKNIFWTALDRYVKEKYQLNDVSGSDKLLNTAVLSAIHPEVRERRSDNYIVHVSLPEPYADIMEYKGNCGYFFEYVSDDDDFSDILPILKKDIQTVTFYGEGLYEKLKRLVIENGVRGVDRIVPVGRSMQLSYEWDGYDLPLTLSRLVSSL
jgi:hypothetical protein